MYCAQTDLEEVIDQATIVRLTDDESLATDPSDLDASIVENAAIGGRLSRALVDATATIDGFLRTRYLLPLSPVPPFIRKLAVDLSLFSLFSRRSHEMGMPEERTAAYKAAHKALELMRAGELDAGSEPQPTESSAVVADTDGPDREFTHDTMKDF